MILAFFCSIISTFVIIYIMYIFSKKTYNNYNKNQIINHFKKCSECDLKIYFSEKSNRCPRCRQRCMKCNKMQYDEFEPLDICKNCIKI
jgi:hypothetical protein